jgi:hypothetical protein
MRKGIDGLAMLVQDVLQQDTVAAQMAKVLLVTRSLATNC